MTAAEWKPLWQAEEAQAHIHGWAFSQVDGPLNPPVFFQFLLHGEKAVKAAVHGKTGEFPFNGGFPGLNCRESHDRIKSEPI